MLPATKEQTFAPLGSGEEISSLPARGLLGVHDQCKIGALSKTRLWGFGENFLPVIRATWQLSANTRRGREKSRWKTVPAPALDANGNTLTEASARSYTWDFENRLVQAVIPGTNGGTTTFKYNPFSRRIQKSGHHGTTNYLYDGFNSIEELDGSGNILAKYSQGLDTDEPLSMLRSGVTSYFQADDLRSTTSLSSAAGALAKSYTYDAFGNLTA